MNTRLVIGLTVYLLATSTLFAQEQRRGRPERAQEEVSAEVRQAIDDCHTSLNIARPERPPEMKDRNSQPTEEEIAKMKEMDANRKKIRSCVESKGYRMPDFGGPGRGDHHGRPPESSEGSSLSDDSSSSGAESSATAQ